MEVVTMDKITDAPVLSYAMLVFAMGRGPITADYFAVRTGLRNWLVLDDDAIHAFVIESADRASNTVVIRTVAYGAMVFDADELALRIEAS
jgi:hypothetical protein